MDTLNGYSVPSGITTRKLSRHQPTNKSKCTKNMFIPSITSNNETERTNQKQHQQLEKALDDSSSFDLSYQTSRKDFHQKLVFLSVLLATTSSPAAVLGGPVEPCHAFEGGVGGLGKTKPQTGITFYNPELVSTRQSFSSTTPGIYSVEIIGPDNTPILISFYAPWPMLKSNGIESRDLTSTESAFVQVATKPAILDSTTTKAASVAADNGFILPREFFEKSILSSEGKYGMYGLPTGIKVSKLNHDPKSQTDLYLLSFTTMTPAMRESDRKVYVSTKVIGNGVYMLVTGTTAGRFKGQEALLRKVADSFECIEAPKSQIRGGKT